MPNINQIRISGTSYDIQDSNATKVVNITQAEYDVLPASAKTANILYNITDAEAADLSQYWTSAETQSAITEATSGKVSTSDFNTYSGSVDTALNSKASQTDLSTLSGTVTSHTANTSIHVSPEQIAAWNAKSDFSGSYNDLTNKLSAGTNITIVDNVISATGGGGGGNSVVELTQAQYDALSTIDPNIIYVITDAQGGDLSQYWTSAQTQSAITEAVTRKVDTTSIVTAITSSSTNAQVPSAKCVYDQVGGLKLVKLTQSAYDGLLVKDNDTLYIING